MVGAEYGPQQAGHSGGGPGVPEVGLGAAQGDGVTTCGVRFGQGGELGAVQLGAPGRTRLHVPDVARTDPGLRQRLPHRAA